MHEYSKTSGWTLEGQSQLSALERCPYFSIEGHYMMSGQLHCTLGTRGFFSRATGSFFSSAKGRRHERRSGSLLKDLTETG